MSCCRWEKKPQYKCLILETVRVPFTITNTYSVRSIDRSEYSKHSATVSNVHMNNEGKKSGAALLLSFVSTASCGQFRLSYLSALPVKVYPRVGVRLQVPVLQNVPHQAEGEPVRQHCLQPFASYELPRSTFVACHYSYTSSTLPSRSAC